MPLRVPPRWEAHLLAPLERRVPGPRPGGRVVRRVRVGAPGVEPAVLLDQRELLLGGEGDPVLHRQLVEGAGERSLQARAVVPEDVDDERVVELAHLLDRVEQAADVPVGVLLEAGVDLHLPRVQLLLAVRERVPGGERVRSRREHRIRRDHAQRLLPFEGLLAEHVPPLVELAAVLLAPLDRDLVRRVRAPGRVVDEPRLFLVLGAHLVQPAHRLIGEVVRPVVLLGVLPSGTPRVVLSCVITGSYWPASPPRMPQKRSNPHAFGQRSNGPAAPWT